MPQLPIRKSDCAAAGVDPDSIVDETVLYEGPTRGVCPKFPRNTNTLAAIAYAGIGFERTHSTLVVNPAWNTATVAIHAKGEGVEMNIEPFARFIGEGVQWSMDQAHTENQTRR